MSTVNLAFQFEMTSFVLASPQIPNVQWYDPLKFYSLEMLL